MTRYAKGTTVGPGPRYAQLVLDGLPLIRTKGLHTLLVTCLWCGHEREARSVSLYCDDRQPSPVSGGRCRSLAGRWRQARAGESASPTAASGFARAPTPPR